MKMEHTTSKKRGGQSSKRSAAQSLERDQPDTLGATGAERNDTDDILIMEEEGMLNTHDPLPFGEGGWDVKKYCGCISMRMVNQSEDELDLEFDLVNVEAPIANALRRVLIAEVPSMAIEKVFLYQNTSCIQDEVFCHRLGLIPIHADARQFAFPPPTNPSATQKMNTDILDEEPPGDAGHNLVFELNVTCPRVGKRAQQRSETPKQLARAVTVKETPGAAGAAVDGCVREGGGSGNWVVYTGAFEWRPIGDQRRHFAKEAPRLVHNDIILAKLRPGQEIEARCHCVKGIGRDHAKFSPVATATYRLLPQIKLKRHDFDDEQATRLRSCFSTGVIGRDEQTGRVYVRDARSDTSSRNVFMHDDLKDAVEMGKKKTHFIFSVESTGALPSHKLVVEACKVMREKVDRLRDQISARLEML
ncbi:hypothetical protein GPALN_012516 [Globodera pallida]|nr:hypothetical protein GPALN_012516 [Globodera pallida]